MGVGLTSDVVAGAASAEAVPDVGETARVIPAEAAKLRTKRPPTMPNVWILDRPERACVVGIPHPTHRGA